MVRSYMLPAFIFPSPQQAEPKLMFDTAKPKVLDIMFILVI
jgi:hypothetical protein